MTEHAGVKVRLEPTQCPICGTVGQADELYSPTFDVSSFNSRVFSARRLPDRVHYRMVRCRTCGLVRSDPAAGEGALSELYERSTFDYAEEVPHLRETYGRYLAKAKRHTEGRTFLEIGCGSGFMLEAALSLGYKTVRGVEPSRNAVAASTPEVRDWIVNDIMRPGLFSAGAFDTVCLFQVFDHVADPRALLEQIRTVLKPDGVLLCLNHNVRSLSARVLGDRSPIVDIEHCYLYSPATMTLLMQKCGFDVVDVGAATNTISLQHLMHLVPAPAGLKRGLMAVGTRARIGRIPVRLRLGNLYAIGRKR